MNTLLQILKLLPQILAAVIGVESVITAPQSGATKKQLVLDSIDAVAKAGEASDVKVVAAISALIDNIVASLNKSGLFQKAAA